ncbi:hypothetical protein J4E91_000561 [Alternaria rosae]|nr:hypothetical protein J4E91_000561 [Alternaria rosae]
MAGIKRSINGQAKPQNQPQQPEDVAMTDATPPCGQPQAPSSNITSYGTTTAMQTNPPKLASHTNNPPSKSAPAKQPSKPRSATQNPRQKLARLPKNTTISTRPLLHAPVPTPFSSSASPKALYITATSPYVPALKRIRKLLMQITKREKQSAASLNKAGRGGEGRGGRRYAQANGRLEARDVEAEIAGAMSREGGDGRGGNKGSADGVGGSGISDDKGEKVHLKATGRAIPRALEIGLHFQGEEDCWVKVEMGNVSAIDDVEVKDRTAEDEGGEEGMRQVEEDADDVPETRIRMLSSVTVTIGLK